jgi:hypothetical protein
VIFLTASIMPSTPHVWAVCRADKAFFRPVVQRLHTSAAEIKRRPSLTLYTGTDCQLCDVVKMELDKVAKRVGVHVKIAPEALVKSAASSLNAF